MSEEARPATDAAAAKRYRPEVGPRDIGVHATVAEVLAPAPLPRSRGVIKTLFSDFIVREMRYRSGEPVVLTSLDVPAAISAKARAAAASAAASAGQEGTPAVVLPDASSGNEEGSVDEPRLRAVFGASDGCALPSADVDAIVALAQSAAKGQGITPTTLTATFAEKAQRTAVHQAVKSALGPAFESSTVDGAVLIQANAGGRRAGAGGAADGKRGGNDRRATGWHSAWPKEVPAHLHFTLYKENLDTGSALRALATKLNISQKRLCFAGTKDKRGVTTQRVSCRHLEAERVAGLNKQSFGRNGAAFVGDFTYEDYSLGLGRLEGNQFTIVVRGVDPSVATPETLAAYTALLKANGFLNFFGPQRFGTTTIPTSDVGRRILAKDFAAAVRMILASKSEVVPALKGALETYDDANGALGNGRFEAALAKCPHFCHDEKDVLRVLATSPNNFEGAVMQLPRNTAMLYCHAVQSLVWNHALSRRVAACPRPVVGDLVFVSGGAAAASPVTTNDDDAAANDDNDATADGNGDDEGAVAGTSSYVASQHMAVRRLTEDDVASGRFSLADVLLPVPGPDSELQFPTHPSCDRAAYEALAEDLGASALLRDEHGLAKIFHFHGTYRQAAVVPVGLELEALEYRNPRQLLVLTDAMRLRGETLEGAGCAAVPREQQQQQEQGAETEAQGEAATAPVQHAVRCTFGLRSGSYATSLLREIFDLSE